MTITMVDDEHKNKNCSPDYIVMEYVVHYLHGYEISFLSVLTRQEYTWHFLMLPILSLALYKAVALGR